jgi:small conductance mechanosensitive channel
LARWVSRVVTGLASGSGRLDETVRPIIASAVRYAIMILVFVAALGQIGVQTASLLAVIGAAGLAIGLALQGTLANIAAGIMLLWLRPFPSGDYIEVATSSGIAGTVREIGLFACNIVTFDGITIFAPNSAIWNAPIRNHTRNDRRLLSFTVALPTGADLKSARAALLNMLEQDPEVLRQPAPDVFIEKVKSDGALLTCRLWVRSRSIGQVQRALMAEADARLGGLDPKGHLAAEITRTVPAESDPSRLIGADGRA